MSPYTKPESTILSRVIYSQDIFKNHPRFLSRPMQCPVRDTKGDAHAALYYISAEHAREQGNGPYKIFIDCTIQIRMFFMQVLFHRT